MQHKNPISQANAALDRYLLMVKFYLKFYSSLIASVLLTLRENINIWYNYVIEKKKQKDSELFCPNHTIAVILPVIFY